MNVSPPVTETASSTAVATPPEKVAPLFSIRPSFDQPLAIVHALMAMVAGTILLTIVGGTLLYLLLILLQLARLISPGYIYGLMLVGSIILVPTMFFDLRKKAYQRTVWNFYDTYIDYQYFHFYLERRRGRLRYKDVRDVYQRASALQEQRGLTTLYLYAPSMQQQRNSFSGLRVFDIPRRADFITPVLNLVEKNQAAPVVVAVPVTENVTTVAPADILPPL